MESLSTVEAGDVYGPYRVVRPLGAGGMGTVLLAEDPRLRRFVALKTCAGHSASQEAREHVLREARAAAQLSHPNIAAVHDVLDLDGQLIIVFEFVEGETLAERLRRGRLPVPEVIRIGEQIADGLAAAHAAGIIHRDLKPANVMLTRDGRAKVLDFGIARSAEIDSAETGSLVTTSSLFAGTPAYAAPEQWLGEPLGAHTDIFSLGLVLFEMLSGRRPFDAPSRLSMMQHVIEAPRPHISELNELVPPSVDALITSMLARDPADRPASAREIATTLRSIDRDLPLSQRALPIARRPLPRPWILAAAVALVAAIAALIVPLRLPRQVRSQTVPVVAVLPLANVTGTPTNDYLAAGIADTLTTSLASLSGITVLSRAAVMSAARTTTEPTQLAKELGATYVVEGNVQQSGDRIRISANLVRPDQSVAWADSVEGSFDHVFELQAHLATALGRALALQVSPAERAKIAEQPTRNPDALAAYYRGRALLERRDLKGNTDAALAAFDDAVRLDPDFAIAHAARGDTLWARYIETRDPRDAEGAIAAGTTALRLDPTRANVRYSLAVSLAGSGRVEEAVDEFNRALALQPNYDDARRALGNVLAENGRLEDAVVEYRKAIALRPNYWEHYSALGVALYQAARYDEALDAFGRAAELQPASGFTYQQLGAVYQAKGDLDRALAMYQKATSIAPIPQAYTNMGALLHQRGRYAEAVHAYQQSLALRPNSHATQRNLGDSLRRLGRLQEANHAYEAAAEIVGRELRVNPHNRRNRAFLAVYLAKLGRKDAAEREITEARAGDVPDVQVIYRAAVVYALVGDRTQALRNLGEAIDRGYTRKTAAEDEDFRSLQAMPEFQRLVAPQPSTGGKP